MKKKKPSLRISNIVYGRAVKNNRVTYLVDPRGAGTERAIPEQVVRRRWCRRQLPGYSFYGARLSSTLWRAIPAMLGRRPDEWLSLHDTQLRKIREAKADYLRKRHLKVPREEILSAILSVCGPKNLAALIERHSQPGRLGRSGVPDLFLFARGANGKLYRAMFVEVKKPEEAISQDQRDELAFLQGLGLQAREFRLIERQLPKK